MKYYALWNDNQRSPHLAKKVEWEKMASEREKKAWRILYEGKYEERLKVAKESLDLKVVDELRSGKKVEVIDNLRRKELKPVITVRFSNQPSLFD